MQRPYFQQDDRERAQSLQESGDHAKLLADLSSLYPPDPSPGWRNEANSGLGRMAIVLLLAVGMWYDYLHLTPGPFTLGVIVYMAPPWARALIQARQDRLYQAEKRAHMLDLERQLRALPHVELVTRLTALARREHGGSITGIIEVAKEMAALPGDPPPPEGGNG